MTQDDTQDISRVEIMDRKIAMQGLAMLRTALQKGDWVIDTQGKPGDRLLIVEQVEGDLIEDSACERIRSALALSNGRPDYEQGLINLQSAASSAAYKYDSEYQVSVPAEDLRLLNKAIEEHKNEIDAAAASRKGAGVGR